MKLDENNYQEIISSYTGSDWKPLLDVIPEIEKAETYGDVVVHRNEDGTVQFPFYDVTEVVSKFRRVVYDMPIIIPFDWGEWEEGRKIVNDSAFDYDCIDIPEKCKIITAIVRNDRFCEGVLVGAFESGLILKVLTSIKSQLNSHQQ